MYDKTIYNSGVYLWRGREGVLAPPPSHSPNLTWELVGIIVMLGIDSSMHSMQIVDGEAMFVIDRAYSNIS